MERQLITREVIANLDVLCASYLPPTQMPRVSKIEIVTQSHMPETVEEHTILNDFRFLGIDLEGTIAPYLSKGQPIVQDRHIRAMRFLDRNKEVMRFFNPDVWASQISVEDNYVYFGGHEGTTLLMFEKSILFDPDKDFFYVRSPNGKFNPQNVLATKKLDEKLILGEWIIFDDARGAVNYHFSNPLFRDLYHQGKFKSFIKIYDSVDGIVLKYEEGGKPIMEKNPDGESWSPIGRAFRPVKTFGLPKNISSFNPLTFNTSQYPEIKGQPSEEKYPENEYSLVYVNPAELVSLRWGFNSKIMEPVSGGIFRYHNPLL